MRCTATDCAAEVTVLRLPDGRGRWLHSRTGMLEVDRRQPEEASVARVAAWLDLVHAHLDDCADCAWLNRPHALVVD